MKRWMAAAAMLTLAACASDLDTAPPAQQPGPAPAPAPATKPPPASPRPRPRPSEDMCGAYEAQDLVGRPRSEIPVPVLPALQRVACTTCPVTMDFNPKRLNFFYDATSGLIKQVKCG
jgi:hypothetical protein